MAFETVVLSQGFFVSPNQVNCAAVFDGGRRMVYGTDDGVYVSNIPIHTGQPIKMLVLLNVKQIDVLEDQRLLLVLSEHEMLTFSMDALDHAGWQHRGSQRVGKDIEFFKIGHIRGKVGVCTAKISTQRTTFRMFEATMPQPRGNRRPFVEGGLNMTRTFYIPIECSAIHYMNTQLILGCTSGLEIVDYDSLDTTRLLSPAKESFTAGKTSPRPMAIFRIDDNFLLCYDGLALFVDGGDHTLLTIRWEGRPTGFALQYPYVLAVEPTFVEIRHVDTGAVAQIIRGPDMRLLFADVSAYRTDSADAAHPTRDEILVRSDDRVMTIRLAAPAELAGENL